MPDPERAPIRPAVSFALGSAGVLLSGLLHYAASLLIARRLGPAGLGEYSVLISTGFLTTLVGDLGMNAYIVREMAVSAAAAGAALRSVLRVKAVMAGVSLALLLAAWPFLALPARLQPGLLLAWAAGGGYMLVTAYVSYVRGRGRMDLELVWSTAQAVCFITLVWVSLRMGLGVPGCTGSLAVSYALALGLAALLVRRQLPPAPAGSLKEGFGLMRAGLPLAATVVAQMAQLSLPALFLKRAAGPASVGIFTAAYNLVRYWPAIQAVAYSAMIPPLQSLEGGEDPAGTRSSAGRFRQFVGVSAAVGIVGAGALVLGAGPLVTLLYGASFRPSAAALQLLATLVLLAALEAPCIAALLTAGRQAAVGRAALAGVLVLVAALALLAPADGVRGTCLAVLLGQATNTLFLVAAALAAARNPQSASDARDRQERA